MSNDKSIGSVTIGNWVRVVEQASGDKEVFHIVEAREVNYLENKIPPDNPMARALVGSKPGDQVGVEGPHGTVKFSVLEVGRR